MKRPIFIIVGTILVFILLGVWIYVLFFSSPATSTTNTYTDLDIGDTTDPDSIPVTNTATDEPTVNVTSPDRLRQITTKPTIGYEEVTRDASSTPEVYYIEAGTGHIFSIDLLTGAERRISGTTIPLSSRGAITPDGKFVFMQSGSGGTREFVIGEFSSTSNELMVAPLEEKIIDFRSTSDNNFLYAVQTNNSVIGKEYLPLQKADRTLFTVPFREAVIDWGDTATATHYAYPKTANKLEGFVYQVKDGVLKRLPIDGFGLSAVGGDDYVLYSKQVKGEYSTYIFNLSTGISNESAVKIIPEKCATIPSSPDVACASIFTSYNSETPDRWYKGLDSYADSILTVSSVNFRATYLSNTLKESGRELDIVSPKVSVNGARIYFINKNDNLLWLYQLKQEARSEESN